MHARREALRAELETTIARGRGEVRAVLRPAQVEAFDACLKERPGLPFGPPEGAHHRGPPGFGPPGGRPPFPPPDGPPDHGPPEP